MSGYVRDASFPPRARLQIQALKNALFAERNKSASLSKLLDPSKIKPKRRPANDWNKRDWTTPEARESILAAADKYRVTFDEAPGTGLGRLLVLDAEVRLYQRTRSLRRPSTTSRAPAPATAPAELADAA